MLKSICCLTNTYGKVKHKTMEKIKEKLMEFKNKYENITVSPDAAPVSREKFTFLLSGISTCRKFPGIPVHMGYDALYHCDSEENIKLGLEHMKNTYKVTDKESLLKVCYSMFNGSGEYEQFMTFWNDSPLFDVNQLQPEAQKGFAHCKKLAENFYPVAYEKGLYAWDINERIGLCRNAVALGIITDEEFWTITDNWVRMAQVFYHSYAEYAISCLCGAVYELGRYDPDVSAFLDINCTLTEHLLGNDGAWCCNQWYSPKEREWADLLGENPGCLITKAALEAESIGYMYRETPLEGKPDSGWRFFTGEESSEYMADSSNIVITSLNIICNLQPDILPFIYAKTGRKFIMSYSGWIDEE